MRTWKLVQSVVVEIAVHCSGNSVLTGSRNKKCVIDLAPGFLPGFFPGMMALGSLQLPEDTRRGLTEHNAFYNVSHGIRLQLSGINIYPELNYICIKNAV